jgi:hypothetical protein
MVRKQLKARNASLRFIGISRQLERMFRLNGLEYLIPVHVGEATQGWQPDRTIYAHLSPPGEIASPSVTPARSDTEWYRRDIPVRSNPY